MLGKIERVFMIVYCTTRHLRLTLVNLLTEFGQEPSWFPDFSFSVNTEEMSHTVIGMEIALTSQPKYAVSINQEKS